MPCSKCKDTATGPQPLQAGDVDAGFDWLQRAENAGLSLEQHCMVLHGFTRLYMFYSWKIVLATHSNSWYTTHSSLSAEEIGVAIRGRYCLFMFILCSFCLGAWVLICRLQGIRSRRQGQRIAVMRTAGWRNQNQSKVQASKSHAQAFFSNSWYVVLPFLLYIS